MNTAKPLPKTMLAVCLHGTGFENLRVEEIPVPRPNDDQLLSTRSSGITRGTCARHTKRQCQKRNKWCDFHNGLMKPQRGFGLVPTGLA